MISVAPSPSGRERTAEAGRDTWLNIGAVVPFLLVAFASLGVARPRLVQNVTFTDVLLLALIVTWAVHVVRDDRRPTARRVGSCCRCR